MILILVWTILISLQQAKATVATNSVVTDIEFAVKTLWEIAEGVKGTAAIMEILEGTDRHMLGELANITRQLDAISQTQQSEDVNSLLKLLSELPNRIRFELRLNDYLDYQTSIEIYYDKMKTYLNTDKLNPKTWNDFAQNVVENNPNSVIYITEKLYSYVVPNKEEEAAGAGLLKLLSRVLQDNTDIACNAQRSPQQILFQLYDSIVLINIKSYSMIQFAYMLKTLNGEGNFTEEANISRNFFHDTLTNTMTALKKVARGTSLELWRCDPKNYVAGETYEEVTRLLQGYVLNEKNLNWDGRCFDDCEEHKYAKDIECVEESCKIQQTCTKAVNCQSLQQSIDICDAGNDISRRYDFVKNGDRVYGKQRICNKSHPLDAWTYFLFWKCTYCFCLCDQQGTLSDRYINLRATLADVKNNYVVTGVRFVKHNRIIHLQIQQGQLLPYGEIDLKSVGWVPVENYTITDKTFFDGQDYHTLTFEKRAVDLHNIAVDDGHLVTGVRFKMLGSHVNLEIWITPFNFTAGQLIEPEIRSVYKDHLQTPISPQNPRTKVLLSRPDIPILTPKPSEPNSKNNQYIEFVNSNIEKDAAQTTVPFIDIQPVESSKPVPLSGVGIFHKGQLGFGGFITPKIMTYDFSEHLQYVFQSNDT